MLRHHLPLSLLGLSALCAAMSGATAPLPDKKPTISDRIEQLGARRYRERVEAEEALEKLGFSAMQPLSEALDHPDLEIARRAREVLDRLAARYLKKEKKELYERLGKLIRSKDVPTARWACGVLVEQADVHEDNEAKEILKPMVTSKDPFVAAQSKLALRPTIEKLRLRRQALLQQLQAASRTGNNQKVQEILREYQEVSREYSQRRREELLRRR